MHPFFRAGWRESGDVQREKRERDVDVVFVGHVRGQREFGDQLGLDINVVPEPVTRAMIGFGLVVGLVQAVRWQFRRRQV